MAQFSHLEIEEIDNKGLVPGATIRVWAVMMSEGDIIDAVYGEKSAPMRVSSTEPFFQHFKGGATSADIQRYDTEVDPSLLYDSWVTIGATDNYMNAVSGFIMDFETFDAGGELATNDGAWFVTPDKRQAAAPPSRKILILQLTTGGDVTGVINIHGRTKAILDDNGNLIAGQDVINEQGIPFSYRNMNSNNKSSESEVETKSSSMSQGSCVLIDKERGCFVTNHHVVDGAKAVSIATDIENLMEARVIKSDSKLDLAVVVLESESDISFVARNYQNAVLRTDVKKGEDVRAVGFPKAIEMGFDSKITGGIISSNSFLENSTMYQIDAAITSGNSGGGLYDTNGNLVGITTAGYRPDQNTENVNGAVKAFHLEELLQQTPCSSMKSSTFSSADFDALTSKQVFPVLSLLK